MMTARRPLGALALAIAALSCGPYPDVAQRLDVTARVAGDTWIAAVGDRTELRVLIVGAPQGDGTVRFAFASVHVKLARGDAVFQRQGRWIEVGSSGATTLHVEHTYSMPDESGESILRRRGTYRSDDAYDVPVTVTRGGGRLVVSGNADVAGTYVPLVEALGALATRTPQDQAACAFHVANVGVLMSQGRIIGFGGPGITQYRSAESFVGTVAGTLRISATLSGGFPPDHSTVTQEYSGFQDNGGVRLDGPMVADADSGGNGHMSGVVTVTITPAAADGTPGAPITGTIDYGGAGVPANALQLVNGNAEGGYYTLAIAGGGTALVQPQTPPSPSVSDCLGLP